MDKPYSQACENNKAAILNVLLKYFAMSRKVLEIGSGTGQHAVYFAPQLAHLTWQTSDAKSNHDGINAWIKENPSDNLRKPISLVIGQDSWPASDFDAVFSANTAHIMQKFECKLLFEQIQLALPKDGVFCLYGPFNQHGHYTSQSNADFDLHLRTQGYGGLCDIDELQIWAPQLDLVDIIDMPANNKTLVWCKR